MYVCMYVYIYIYIYIHIYTHTYIEGGEETRIHAVAAAGERGRPATVDVYYIILH